MTRASRRTLRLALLAVALSIVAGLVMPTFGYHNALTDLVLDLVLYPVLIALYLVTCLIGGRCIVC